MQSSFFNRVIRCLRSVFPIWTCSEHGWMAWFSSAIDEHHVTYIFTYMLNNILTFVYCLKNNYLILKHFEFLGQMHHTEWKAEQQQRSRGKIQPSCQGKGWSFSLITSHLDIWGCGLEGENITQSLHLRWLQGIRR